MKISYNWMREFIPVDMPAEEVAEILTGTGLEVEKIHDFSTLPTDLEGVVVGKVLEVKKHPNADKLFLTRVDLGDGKPVQIVCGAPNVAEGQKVPVATIGTKLIMPDGKELKIKKGKIRGELSYGMICAEDELGLSDNHEGIMVLDPEIPEGTPFREVVQAERDKVFEIGLTPNRSDAMSHFGVARDLYAKLKFEKHDIHLKTRSTSHFVPEIKKQPVSINIEEKNKCPRYVGLVIHNVKPVESPQWLQNRLKAIGINPKNLLVDVTNFVMHDIGQPMHAFDLRAVKGNKVIVRNAREGEKILALNDEEYTLTADDLVIANEEEPMAIAGVIGGKHSAINDSTTDILLESAYFDPVAVRKTAKRLGISTDSSFRFERGVDPTQTELAMKWAAILIKEYLPKAIITEIVDETVKMPEPVSISLSYEYIWRLTGEQIPPDDIKQILHLLDFKIILSNKENLTVEVPLYRHDVTRPADVVEEILRIYGYDRVCIPEKISFSVAHESYPGPEIIEREAAALLTSSGFYETMSVSMQNEEQMARTKSYQPAKAVKLLNPVSNEYGVMRQSLLLSMLQNIRHNIHRQRDNLAFFEFGRVYFQGKDGKYCEEDRLALALTGHLGDENWLVPRRRTGFFHLKGMVEKLFRRFGLDYEEAPAGEGDLSEGIVFKSGKSDMAVLGKVNPGLAADFDIKKPVYFASIRWNDFIRAVKERQGQRFKPFSKYPAVRRDLALLVDKDVSYASLYKAARKAAKNVVESVNLFDVYEGDKIPEGKKSYAMSFVLRSPSKTLSDKEADRITEQILEALARETGARLRDK